MRGSFCVKTRAAIHRHLYETHMADCCHSYKPIISGALSTEHLSAQSDNPSSNSPTVIANINTKGQYANTFVPGL